MPQQPGPGLSLAEWLVLCLASERPTHGFAIASVLAEDGSWAGSGGVAMPNATVAWPRLTG